MEAATTRCKPGGLAVVIRADFENNLGRIVQVIAPDVGKSFVQFVGRGEIWWVTCPTLMTWSSGNQTFWRKAGPVPDECLMPIREIPDDKTVDEARVIFSHKEEKQSIAEGVEA